MKNLLDIGVSADDVLDLIRVRVLEGEAAGSDQHPLPVLHPETIHDRQNLTLQLHHLQREEHFSLVSLFPTGHYYSAGYEGERVADRL